MVEQHSVFTAKHIHLTGIKGVAMTSLAQCLVDIGKTLTGSDVKDDFVTKDILKKLAIKVFPLGIPNNQLPTTELVIYTSAHGGPNNPEVVQAKNAGIQTLSQAEALAQLFNIKEGIAICGVGGKSTTSAMLTWILEKMEYEPSFSVGVGKIVGMERTGKWNDHSPYFVAEADEYVIDPTANKPVPRFSFLKPGIIICTNIKYDHPDVYSSFDATKKAYHDFFHNLKPNGTLIINGDDQELVAIATKVKEKREDITLVRYGQNETNDYVIADYSVNDGHSTSVLSSYNIPPTPISLTLPGLFNHFNATGALIAANQITNSLEKSVQTLSTFRSTQRRFEFVGEKKGVMYYDDYAHHPNEISSTIQALHDLYPNRRKVVAFQPHTFSRTKQLFSEFVKSFEKAEEIVLLDIFASARESFDNSISSDMLAQEIRQQFPNVTVHNVHTVANLATFCQQKLQHNDVLITLGAGDIYTVHDMISE